MSRKVIQAKVPWYRSLAFSLILWFLPLTVIPFLIVSYDSYKTNTLDLEKTAYHDIKEAALLEKKFLENWFHYRLIDIKNWSSREENILFLEELVDELNEHNHNLTEYIESEEYLNTTIELESDMLNLVRDYDYLYDLFLIDTNGNILYTVEKESDLGANLLQGTFAKTRFSSAFQATMKDRKVHFSDLEFYAPSGGAVAGFLTAPIYNSNGELLGAFALQIKLEKVYEIFKEDKILNQYFTYYLVGEDALQRSKIYDDDEILVNRVDTYQFKLWKDEHGDSDFHNTNDETVITEYLDPFGDPVFGMHTDIDILGVKWALISEAKLEPINNLKEEIISRTIIYVFIILIVVFLIVIGISTFITRPIIELSEISERFAAGERNIYMDVDINSKNEVGLLTMRFLDMIEAIKKGETALDEQKHALDAHSIVAITDIKGTITYVNDKFVAISGYSREELIGKNHRIFNSGNQPKEYWRAMFKTICNGEVWHDEVKNLKKDATPYWLDTTIVPFMDEKKKPKSYITIRTDITDKKKDEAELIKAKLLAEESVRVKSEFFASMSHEIRTPMNGVIGMLGLLLNTELNETQRHQAYLAQSSANALLNLINDILDFSKFDAGKLELEQQDFNVRKEFGDFAEAMAFKAQEKGIEVVLDMTDVDTLMLKGDMGRIRQILTNIVGNAIKFTSKGFVSIDVSLLKKNANEAILHISVKDSGIGIPEDKIDTLFDSFSQVDASTTRKYGGTGLGLAIVKKLSKLMQGDVSVKSEYGKGSEFLIDITVALSDNQTIVLPRVAVNDKTALIIDESYRSAKALSRQLEHWGMRVYSCKSEEELLSLKDEKIDIFFINKDANSLALFRELKEQQIYSNTRFILLTSLEESGNVAEYMSAGFDAHYPKPATSDDILAALDTLQRVDKKETLVLQTPHKEETNAKEWSSEPKILLVDDNKVNQLVANGILEEMGLEADVANNGLEALEILKNTQESPYSIVLMDCQMPEMDGYEATQAIRSEKAGAIYKEIPIIAMTANAMEGDKEKCFASGMDDYLSKPIDPEKLERLLQQYS